MIRSRTEGIVLHRAEVFTNQEYHFVVRRDGAISRCVPLDEKGAHAKDYNATAIGIAIYGDFASMEKGVNYFPTDAQIDSTIVLMKVVNAMYGGKLWATGHSNLGTKGTDVPQKLVPGHTCPGENFPLADVIRRSNCKVFLPPTIVT